MNITLDEALYERLKARAPVKKMSAFIAQALEARLGPSEEDLVAAYRQASGDGARERVADEWSEFEGEGWPEW